MREMSYEEQLAEYKRQSMEYTRLADEAWAKARQIEAKIKEGAK